MIETLRSIARSGTYGVPFAIATVVLGVIVGQALAQGGQRGLLIAVVVLGLITFLVRPSNVAILALVGMYVVQRLGSTSTSPGSSGGITYSDAILTAASLLALVNMIGTPELRRLRTALIGLAVYLAALVPTVALHGAGRSDLEFAHRLVLVGGALIVGAWIAREGIVDKALRALVVASAVLALIVIADGARHGFAPALPFQLNKNLLGAQFAAVVVLAIAAPRQIGLGPRGRRLAIACLLGALIVTESRGAIVGALVALFVAVVAGRANRTRGSRGLVILLTVVLGVGVYLSARDQLSQPASERSNNALGVRFNVEKRTREIWRTSPITGVGLKYFNSGGYGYYAQAANNAIDNELAESGLIGAGGFVVMQVLILAAGFRRRGDPLVLAGTAIVLGELTHGMVDIYWTAGAASLPFLILGVGLGRRPGVTSPDESDVHRPRHSAVVTP